MLTSIKVFTGNTITVGQPVGITLNKVQGVLEKGVKYSLQFKVINYSSINTLNYIYVGTQKVSNIDISQGTVIDTVDGKEVRLCSVEFTASSKMANPVIKIGRNMVSSDTSNTLMYELTDFQLERGYKTNYSPNSNDLQIVKTDLESKINQLADSLQFYVAKNDFDNLGNTVSSALGQIEVSTGEISLKVEQTDIDNAKNELEGSIDKKISNAKAEIKMTTDSISQRVSSTESTTSTLTNKVTVVESTANTANSKVDNLQVGGTNLARQSNIKYGYIGEGNGNENITSSLNSNKDYFGIDYIPVKTGDIFTITSYNSTSNIKGYIGVIIYNTSKVFVAESHVENAVNSTTPVSKTVTIASDGYIRYTARGFGELKVKLEKGNKATDWSPAPEDVQGDIDTAQTTANSANTLANTANNTANTNKNNITTLQTTVTTTNNRVAELTTNLDGITQRVASNEETITTTNAKLDGLQVGGRNYIPTSGNFTNSVGNWIANGSTISIDSSVTYFDYNTIKIGSAGSSGIAYNGWIKLKPNTTYTYSITAKADKVVQGGSSEPLHMWLNTYMDVAHLEIIEDNSHSSISTSWGRSYIVFKTPNNAEVYYWRPFIYGKGDATVWVANFQCEEGNKPSDWTPPIEEVQSQIDNVDSKVQTTNNKVASIETNLNGITQRVSSTESTVSSHTYVLDTVDSRIDTAKNSAISTASSDATTKANNALASAKTDATTKANNALADAKTYTNGQITTVNTTINNKVAEIKATTDAITQRVSSTESSTTTLTTKLNNLAIGGTNLLLAVNIKQGNLSGTGGEEIYGDRNFFRTKNYIGVSGNTDYHIKINKPSGDNCKVEKIICYTNNGTYIKQIILNTTSSVITTPSNCAFIKAVFIIDGGVENTLVNLFRIKLEKGNRPTDWTPAPEDVQSQIDTAQSTANTANTQATTNKNNISTLTTTVNNTNSKVSSLETNLNSITSRVSATETTTTTLNNKVNTAQSTADSATTKANNAQNTANTANSTANTNKNNISSLTTRVSTAESKLTKDSLTTTIGSHYTTSSDVNGIVTSKGYATTSQVQQTKNELTATFKSSGGYNLIRNGCAKLDTSGWSNNGGGIGRVTGGKGGVVNTYFSTSFPNGIATGSIELKNNTEYVYQAMIYLPNNTLQGYSGAPLHFWCATSPETAGLSQLTILDYSQNIPTANTWTKCYVHFRTASSGNVYFKPFIYTGGASMTVYVSEIMLCESSVPLPYSPHPSEIYDGITKIDKDGITVTQSNAKSKTTMNANGFAITRTDTNNDIFRVGSNGLLTLNGVFKCYKDGANMSGARLESSGAIMFGYNSSTSTKPVFASGLWTDENMGYFSVGYTRADVTDENGCLWMSPQQGNNGCRLTYSKLVGGNMASTNLYFQKDGALLFSSNINGLNSTDDRYTYQFDSGVSTRSLRCDNLRTYHIYPRNTGSSNIGSPSMRYRDIFVDSLSTTNNQLRLGTVKSDGSWQTYGALDINSSTGYIFPHKGNGQLSLGTSGNRFHGIYLVNSPNVSSDERLKTDIHYLDEPMPEEPTILDGRVERNMKITTKDMYDFIKDDLKLASYRYNLNLERGNTSTDYGFIAQDILYTKVGSELIQLEDKEDLNSTLSYNQGNYISTIVGALQEAINKIEVLEKKVQELESKLV